MAGIETLRDLRRTQIIREGRALVAEGGLSALTFGALEKRLAFTRGVITYHFKNKAEIVDAVLASAVAEIDSASVGAVEASQSHEDAVRATLSAVVNGFLAQVEATRILIHFWSRIPHDTRAAEVNARLYARYRRWSEGVIRAGQAAGVFRRDIAAAPVAANIVGTVIGVVTQAIFEPGAVDPAAMVEEAAEALLTRLAVK